MSTNDTSADAKTGRARRTPGSHVNRGFYLEAPESELDSKIADGPIQEKWTRQKDGYALVTPNNHGEAKRDDENFSYVAAWKFTGVGKPPILHKEPLSFAYVHPAQRSYK